MTHVKDALNLLDWIRDDWDDHDEWAMTKKLQRLHTVLLDVHDPLGLDLYAQLCRARIVENGEWRSILVRLRALVATALTRPEYVCGHDYGPVKCQIVCHSEASLAEHRGRIHGVTANHLSTLELDWQHSSAPAFPEIHP